MHQRHTLSDSLSQIVCDTLMLIINLLIDTLFFGNLKYSVLVNSRILMYIISYILCINRFDGNLVGKLVGEILAVRESQSRSCFFQGTLF